MTGATGLRFAFPRHDIPRYDAPMFERIGGDEYAQLQNCRQATDTLQQRVLDLERVNLDLEYRLEDQARQCMDIEKECVSIERTWETKCKGFENEIISCKLQFDAQKMKSDRVRDHLSRTERELYGILQRKYELIRGPGGSGGLSSSNMSLQRASWDQSGKPLSRRNENFSTGPYGSTDELTATQLVSSKSASIYLSIMLQLRILVFDWSHKLPHDSYHCRSATFHKHLTSFLFNVGTSTTG